jgi:hypothetical protein
MNLEQEGTDLGYGDDICAVLTDHLCSFRL